METTATIPIPTGEGLTFEKVWAALMETRERQEKTDRMLTEKFDRTDRVLDEKFDKLDKIVGRLGNRFGEMIEHLVAPNIREKFNELGFEFTKISGTTKIKEPGKLNDLAEIDILLENGDIAIVVEVKARPTKEDIDDHVERMEKIRYYADIKEDNRKYRGAIAGAIMNNEIRSYIINNGFYLIEQTGDTVQITIPEGFKPREW